MKRTLGFLLTICTLFLFATASAQTLPAITEAPDIPAVTPQQCTETLALRDGINTIARAGAYHITGSCTGQLVVDAKGAYVSLLFDGISITSPEGPALHIKAAQQVVITLADGTESQLTDSAVYTLPEYEDEPDGALFSKADLCINGTGSLRVTARYDDGIVSKDSLLIACASLTVDSKGDAIRGKDSVVLDRANITITAGKDGVKSTNDTDSGRGWVCCLDSCLTISAREDGIQAERELTIHGGMYRIISGGGCQPEYRQTIAAPVRKADQPLIQAEKTAKDSIESGKGVKATDIRISSGMMVVSSRDDALHANGSITIHDGYIDLSSNDDGIHADDTFTLLGGSVTITESYEGIEAAHIHLNGGTTDVTAIDDGWNAASKAVSGAESAKGKKNRDFDIIVSDGEHRVLSGGDAIDSNGSILISGGVTCAASSNAMKEVPIDYPKVCECRVTGGVLIASGSYGRNTQHVTQSDNQASVMLKWKDNQTAGTPVALLVDGQEVLSFAPAADFKCVIVSAPALQAGQQLTVQQGDVTCRREITDSVMTFPVTQRKKASSLFDPDMMLAGTTRPAAKQSYGTLTAHPATAQSLGYWFYTPQGAGKEKLPLIVYLHGGSGKGSDLTQITSVDGFPRYLRDGKLGNVRAYVLIPQCPANKSGWQSIATQVFALIDRISNQVPVDTSRVILTGHSMGGTGTWALGAMAPERFSCIVPMSGSISLTAGKQQALSKVTVWAIVGEKDKTVLPASSVNTIAKLQKAQGNARITLLPGAAHRDVPARAWLDPQLGLLDWMLAQ
ncbi:MAG: carbohydrate-binding domain-containing protein [Aristaeellaceae bacterium]